MEAAVRWSSHSNNRFLTVDVSDPSITLNQVEDFSLERSDGTKDKPNKTSHHAIAKCTKLPNFGAFDWSKTDESIVALGLVSGSASLVKLREHGTGNNESGGDSSSSIDEETSGIVTTFRVKQQQRRCNSIAFSTRDWLAVAGDKTRSDVCLLVFDAARGSGSSSISTNGGVAAGAATVVTEPIRKLCAAELVSSVRFFTSQPQEIIVSAQRSFIRLYDLRDASSSAAVGGNSQVSTRNVHNLTIDPCDENYFASAGPTDEPCVTVWDRRWMAAQASSTATVTGTGGPGSGAAVLDFKFSTTGRVEKSTIWSLRYSGLKRGRLGVSSSDGELKVVDIVDGSQTAVRSAMHAPPVNPLGGQSWGQNPRVAEMRSLEYPWHHVRYGRDKKTRVVAFDWIPATGDSGHDAEQAILTLRPNREIDVLRFSSAKPYAKITGRLDLGIAMHDVSMTEARPGSGGLHVNTNAGGSSGVSEDFGPYLRADQPAMADAVLDESIGRERDSPRIFGLLSMAARQKDRCKRGYLFDCHKNMKVVAGNLQLEHLWEFMQRFKDLAADDSMIYKGLDLSFAGIAEIWSESVGQNTKRTIASNPATPDEAVVGLNIARGIPAFEGERTSFPEHRQLCLAICGWQFTKDDLERECQELIGRGLHYQAIVQAVLHGETNIALNLLRDLIRTKTIQNIGLGALLASDSLNEQQREMCLWMSADTDDPALKALLTFLTTGDWRDVMRTQYLHLGYRIALGLKYLNDTELSNYIHGQTQRAVMNGNLEGILLTGLGKQAMDLFQTYLTRTNDLQTAVLATAFGNPLYVNDLRWPMWKETYFQQMQAWRAFVERSMFTVQYSQMAKTREGRSLLAKIPPQITLKCTHCRKSLTLTNDTGASAATTTSFTNGIQNYTSSPRSLNTANGSQAATRAPRPAAYAGTLCPHCGRHMPRCGICSMWLGMANPSSSRTSAAAGGAGAGAGDGVGEDSGPTDEVMAKFLTFCVSCGHGFHADHAKAWFARHELCPVPDCRCLCGLRK